MKLLGFIFALLKAGASGVGLGMWLASDVWSDGGAITVRYVRVFGDAEPDPSDSAGA